MAKEKVYTITMGQRRHRALWKAWRRSGLSQREFARALGMSPQNFNMLLNMQRVPEDPRALPLEQQQALYRWTDMLPEELWPKPSQDFLDAPETREEIEWVDICELADEGIGHPDEELGRQQCTRATVRRLKPRTQRVIQELLIEGEPSDALGDGLALTRQRINQVTTEALKYLRRLAQRGLIECCA